MPLYTYYCDKDGEHTIFVRKPSPPKTNPCPTCKRKVKNTIAAPSRIDVKLDWNDKASDYQRDPYTQAKAQLRNLSREEQMLGKPPIKITEQMIQATAKNINDDKKGVQKKHNPVVQQQKKQKQLKGVK